MNIISIYRYLKGYIEFKAHGGFGDRFINLCARYEIKIFNIHYKDDSIVACVPLGQVYSLKSICKKSGVYLELIKEVGLYFTMKKNSARKGLLIGIMIYIIFCAFMQQFIWSIDIGSSKNVSEQEILDKFNAHGLTFGTYKKNFDEVNCARKIVNELEGKIQWMAINIKGSKAFVEIHDYNESVNDDTYSDPCNIVADFDGVILSIEAYMGQTVAVKGNGVGKGDLLISGIVENRDLSTSYFEARGRITAVHDVDVNENYKLNNKYEYFSASKKQNYLYFIGIKLPVIYSTFSDSEKIYTKNSYVKAGENTLPFGTICKTNCLKSTDVESTSEKKCFLIALDNYSSTIYSRFSNTNIVDYNIEVVSSEKSVKINGEYTCIDFMGEKQKINNEFF